MFPFFKSSFSTSIYYFLYLPLHSLSYRPHHSLPPLCTLSSFNPTDLKKKSNNLLLLWCGCRTTSLSMGILSGPHISPISHLSAEGGTVRLLLIHAWTLSELILSRFYAHNHSSKNSCVCVNSHGWKTQFQSSLRLILPLKSPSCSAIPLESFVPLL